jgi:hypothetical protein
MFTAAQTSNTQAIMNLANNTRTITSRTTGAATLTAAQFINGVVIQGGTPGAFELQLPTAAAIVAAIVGPQVGACFDFVIDNGGDNTITVTTNTGITLVGTATVATNKNRVLRAVVTNVGTPAVRVICLAALA